MVQALIGLATLVPLVLLVELASLLLDGVRDAGRYWTLGWWALGTLAAATLASALLLFVLHLMDARFGHTVRTAIVDRISRVPLGWFTDRGSATVRGRVHDDVAGLHHLTTHAVIDAVAAVVTPLAILVYLFVVHAGLAAFLLVPLLAAYVLSMRMFTSASYGTETIERYKADVSAAAGSYVEGLGTARIYDRGRDGRLGGLLDERAAFVDSWQRPLIGLKTATDLVTRPTTVLAFLLLIGVPMQMAGWISEADLVAFLVVGTTVASRLLAVAYGFVPIREATAAARRVAETLAEPTLAEAVHPSDLATADVGRRVRFRGVRFGYDAQHPVLEDIDLDLPAGSVTALVGPSGAGKSTLASLLARFHDVDSGEVLIDDVDVRDLATSELYRAVAFVFQDQSLVRATLHDNIALARPDASREEVEAAARSARIHNRIARLDRGYDAVAGGDARLSGGEAQRVAIARAILADPAVLVLDEATAHADPESEHEVQMALGELVAGRTVLVVSHRLHTLTGADRLVVLDRGRVVQQGDHATLVEEDGLYRSLWVADVAAHDPALSAAREAVAR